VIVTVCASYAEPTLAMPGTLSDYGFVFVLAGFILVLILGCALDQRTRRNRRAYMTQYGMRNEAGTGEIAKTPGLVDVNISEKSMWREEKDWRDLMV
jgi:hypothetical protein